MFYVYVLESKKNGDVYVGYTADLRKRFQVHNQGKVISTKSLRPWALVYYEAYRSKKDATRREKQLKERKPKKDLKEQIRNSLTRYSSSSENCLQNS